MPPVTGVAPLDIASLLAQIGGSAGSAYLQAQQAQDEADIAAKKDKRDFSEGKRRFDLGESRDLRQEPMARLALSAQLRQALTAPTHYDFLSSMASRYGGG